MVGTYTRIFRIAQTQIRRISSLENAAATAGRNPRNHHHRVSTQEESSLKTSFKRETKVLKTLSVIMGVFVFCWLPFFVLNCVVPFCDSQRGSACVSDTTFSVFVWFGWANSSLNPVIYAFNADFRKAFSTLLGCGKFCSSSEVQAVDFSNELVSYRHDSTLQKEVAPVPGSESPSSTKAPNEDPQSYKPDKFIMPSDSNQGYVFQLLDWIEALNHMYSLKTWTFSLICLFRSDWSDDGPFLYDGAKPVSKTCRSSNKPFRSLKLRFLFILHGLFDFMAKSISSFPPWTRQTGSSPAAPGGLYDRPDPYGGAKPVSINSKSSNL
ncbi:hypothetical protein F7725_013661 [Dissostichus mawsoni]|uniref:G-protein coupled receptors family 1 profile domain-containing protein n=1 Tax=Dissostichus mawsoni TaxID=36200 RepID=A0A7J5YUT8_DISMA|nr:hypothetical protein F7725_013661 [Dissostichus mawsoni]